MQFPAIKKEKLSEVVTTTIKDAILEGKIKPGEKIPTEHELVEQFQVSRIVIREALKHLEATGLLEIKRGSGMFVMDNGQKTISDAFRNTLLMQHIGIMEITEARLHFEPMVAGLAAEKRTGEQLEDLRKSIARAQKFVDKEVPAKSENINFHKIIAESTQNRVISLMMQTLLYSLEQLDPPDENYRGRDKAAVAFHKKIFDAVKNKKSQQATALEREHILSVRNLLKANA